MSAISSLGGNAASAYLLPQSLYSTTVSGTATNPSGRPGVSANISGPGQLLSQLQQLQSQDPAKFKQLVSEIADQIQSAAQKQGSTPQSSLLNKLAQKFQDVSASGDLSQWKPHHHGHHGQGTYNSTGHAVPSSTDTTATSGSSVQGLLQTISNEVAQALGGTKSS